ncbi:copper homeostasis protein CutC [Winogradskyella sp. A2]|uniref:copper homeostasis protein CutC n=1 Tax=Winogradskyella sp. A2 TaxID=3366944 RepID=UPI00398C705A
MLLEICANSYHSAKNAQEAGAHRIELCNELSVGGITPSYGLIKQINEDLKIPVYVLIRPRSGNFEYSDDEFKTMKQDIKICKKLGCDGIVSGILNEDKSIDIKRTQTLIELSKPLPFTFHRAFDEVIDPKKALEQLIDLGVQRVLTSGQKEIAIKGIELLGELNKLSKGRILIIPGSGINAKNAMYFKTQGFKEIHASASVIVEQKETMFSSPQTVSDPYKIKAILNAI